jgi:hypothetical protein
MLGGATSGFVGVNELAANAGNFSDEEQAALIAFLGTLDGEPLDPSLSKAPAPD